jgi:hypothetical protein
MPFTFLFKLPIAPKIIRIRLKALRNFQLRPAETISAEILIPCNAALLTFIDHIVAVFAVNMICVGVYITPLTVKRASHGCLSFSIRAMI